MTWACRARTGIRSSRRRRTVLGLACAMLMAGAVQGAEPPRLGDPDSRFRQEQLLSNPPLQVVRGAGLRIFATPFNHADGFGDGPMNPADPVTPGGRPTLANNGTFLRINGLDGQSCVDCHALVNTRSVPPRFGVGGSGGINDVPMVRPTVMDVADVSETGFAFTDGRVIVPPHLFGSGGIQMLAEEMSTDLARQKRRALANPGQVIRLRSKGVQFGSIVADEAGTLDLSAVQGVDDDLVVRPFGRKGEFATVGEFGLNAMPFHFGMQPVEMVGEDVDADGDGVVNELLRGEMSAMEIFITTMDSPWQERMQADAVTGFVLFLQSGCAGCHRPTLRTRSTHLSYRSGPEAAAHYSVDLSQGPSAFVTDGEGGLVVPLFSDLKRHDVGDGLAESFHGASDQRNREFLTARLWGVADTAPYLHDGRALTLDEAILWHGGEAQDARDRYAGMSDDGQAALRAFLLTLRLPQNPNQDVLEGGGSR